MTTTSSSLIELQDKVLDFLLRYRAEKDPELKFVLRKSNMNGALDAGRWFLDGKFSGNKEYLALNFWSGPFYLAYRISEDGSSGLFETKTVKVKPEQKEVLNGAVVGFEKKETDYRVKSFTQAGDNPLEGLQDFLEIDRKLIDKAVEQHPLTEQDPDTGEQRGLGFIDDTEFQSMLRTVLEFREKRQKASLLPPVEPSKPKPGDVPIALESLVVHNFQGIRKADIIGLPRAPWIFLTGNNGFGKTCVLRAAFIGFRGKKDGDIELANGGTDIMLRYWDREKAVVNIGSEIQSPSIAAYGPTRLEMTGAVSKEERTDLNSTSYSLFKTGGRLLSIEEYLRDWYTDPKRKSRYTNVVEMLKSLMPGIDDVFFDEDTRRILYREKVPDEDMPLPPIDFLKLASGFRSVIAFAGDMCVRFFESNPTWKEPKDFEGIVLIDELDLHLHPIWQRQLPALLSRAFPKVQFIASTHSLIPILGAPKGSIFLKVNRTQEEGITVEQLQIDVSTLLPNSILTSPIFGFQDIFPESFDDAKQRIRTETTYEGLVLNDVLDKELLDLARKSGKAQKLLAFTQQV